MLLINVLNESLRILDLSAGDRVVLYCRSLSQWSRSHSRDSEISVNNILYDIVCVTSGPLPLKLGQVASEMVSVRKYLAEMRQL